MDFSKARLKIKRHQQDVNRAKHDLRRAKRDAEIRKLKEKTAKVKKKKGVGFGSKVKAKVRGKGVTLGRLFGG